MGVARIVSLMQSEDRRVLSALRSARLTIAAAAAAFRNAYVAGKTCLVFGAGTSGRLAVIEAAELPPTFGTDPRRVRAVIAGGPRAVFRAREGAEDDFEEGARAAESLAPGDLAIGVSASSVTPFVRGALERARRRGAITALVTSSVSSDLADLADTIVRLPVGPEIVAGSTRLKAGTAAKLALNQITTAALSSAGKVYGPWMVDLATGSRKLKDRAIRIVATASGTTPQAARRLLKSARGEVKTAIVMGRKGVSAGQARRELESAHGDLRRALGPGRTASPRTLRGAARKTRRAKRRPK